MTDERQEQDAQPDDNRRIYCSAMGTLMEFSYCRIAGTRSPEPDAEPGRTLPCARILGCWHTRMDVAEFLRAGYSEQEIQALLAPRPSRMDLLYEAAAEASKRETEADDAT